MSSGWDGNQYGMAPQPWTPVAAYRRPVNAWSVALVAFLLGTLVAFGLSFVVGLFGGLFVFGAAVGGLDLTDSAVLGPALLLVFLPLVVGLVVQMRYISGKGGAHAVLAPVAGAVTGLAVSALLDTVALPGAAQLLLTAGAQVAVMALLVGRGR